MARKALIDTNILVYAYDVAYPEKQIRAWHVLERLRTASAGCMSVKTLAEFFVVITRRIAYPMTMDEAVLRMQQYAAAWPVLDLTPEIVIAAARGVRDYGFSYWDAQMWATARVHGLAALFTEDMDIGRVVEGVTLLNPLDPDFDLEGWLTVE